MEYEDDKDNDTRLLRMSASNNMLSLVYWDMGMMRFVKYAEVVTLSSRWDIAIEYNVEAGGSIDDEVHDNGNVKEKEVRWFYGILD